MDNEFDKQASKILRENVDDISAERWSDEYGELSWEEKLEDFPIDPNNAQGFTPKDIQISFMDDGDWEYDRVGIGKVGDDVFVANIENFGEEDTIWRVKSDSVEEVIKGGLAAGWLVETENGYDEGDKYRWSTEGDQTDAFNGWLRANKVIDNEQRDHDDEQRDQDPHRHEGLSDFDAEQRDQDPYRHTPDR